MKPRKNQKMAEVAHAAGLIAGALEREPPATAPVRDVFDSIRARRSHKRFKPDPVERAVLEQLLEAAVLAPNHKLTEPWGFLVLGPRTKRAYAETKARLKLGARHDAAEKAQKMIDEVMAIPAIVGVTQRLDDDPIRREEDYAAVFMAIQNLLLAATSLGLGTKMHTGDILEDKELRDALQVNDGERIVAFVDVGEPAEELPPKKRVLATERTRWLL